MSENYVAYVGTYTLGKSLGIHIYDVDVAEGTLHERKAVRANNSSHLCLSYNGKYLYSIVDEGVAVYGIEDDGDLTMINSIPINAMRGCHLAVDRTGRYLFVAGYHDGKVTVIRTHSDGRLGDITDGVFHRGTGSAGERNFRPHVNCVVLSPENKYLCAVDNGIDQIKIYRITDEDKLELEDILRCRRDSGPRRLRFSADGRFAYVLCELSNEVDVYTYADTERGPEFEKIQTIETLSGREDSPHDTSAGLILSPDGKYIFTSASGDDTIGMFEVDQETGILTRRFVLPVSGEYPKHIALFPDGRHIVSANHLSNSLTTFSVNYEKNIMLMKGRPLKVDTPNCILITKTAR